MTAFDLLPAIRRARGYRLYDNRKRYLDLWQEGGHALMGHRAGHIRGWMKQQIDRGLLAAYPSEDTARLESALGALLVERRSFRWYADRRRFQRAVEGILGTGATEEIADPAIFDDYSERIMLWRPWLEGESRAARIVVPVLPAPGTGWLTVVAFEDELPGDYYPSDLVSPVVLSEIRRSIFDFIAFRRSFDTSIWTQFESSLWKRKGPYLLLRCNEEEFRSLYRDFLEKGMILAPDSTVPSIIPSAFDPGEVRPLQLPGKP